VSFNEILLRIQFADLQRDAVAQDSKGNGIGVQVVDRSLDVFGDANNALPNDV
jgi:hypothetical protein